MTLELARKRRDQGDLIHELVEALKGIIEQGERYWFQPKGYEARYEFAINESEFNKARAVLEKAKLLDDCVPIEDGERL